MLRNLALTACLLFVFGVATAWAEGPTKIGYVDMREVIAKSEPGSKAMAGLKSKFESMKKDLDKQKDELDKMRDSMQKQGMMLSQEAKQDKELEFKRKVRDFQDTYQDFQRRMAAEEEQVSKPILEKLVDVVKEYGKKNNFALIINQAGSGIVYHDPSVDVTPQITSELNRAWK